MQDARRQRKLKEKLQKINERKESAMAALESLEDELLQHTKEMVGAADSEQETKCTSAQIQTIPIPEPPAWSKSDGVTEDKLKELTLAQKIPTAIADTGASSNCGMDYKSDCGNYEMKDPFEATGRESDKIFQYAGGDLAPATTVKHLPLDVRDPAKDTHIVPGITNNLLSASKFVDANYAWLFDNDKVSVYDKTILR